MFPTCGSLSGRHMLRSYGFGHIDHQEIRTRLAPIMTRNVPYETPPFQAPKCQMPTISALTETYAIVRSLQQSQIHRAIIG